MLRLSSSAVSILRVQARKTYSFPLPIRLNLKYLFYHTAAMTARIINTSLPYPGNSLDTRVPLLAYLIDDDWSSMGQQRGGEEEWVGDSRESGKPSGARVLPRLPRPWGNRFLARYN